MQVRYSGSLSAEELLANTEQMLSELPARVWGADICKQSGLYDDSQCECAARLLSECHPSPEQIVSECKLWEIDDHWQSAGYLRAALCVDKPEDKTTCFGFVRYPCGGNGLVLTSFDVGTQTESEFAARYDDVDPGSAAASTCRSRRVRVRGEAGAGGR